MKHARNISLVMVGGLLALGLTAFAATPGEAPAAMPDLGYKPAPGALVLPRGANWGESSGVALNSKGHVFVFHRGTQPLMEFDGNGKFLRGIASDVFTKAHGLRIDSQDNIWTTDVGSHVVLKLSPEGRVLMVLGRRDTPGEKDGNGNIQFNKPTDIAFGPAGEIFVSDGYGNSRVVKFDKDGNFVKTWGKKGTGTGDFDLPHTLVVDSRGRVIVGDRQNKRIQIFDLDGKFITEWSQAGAPWGLALTPGNHLYMSDGNANRVVKMDLDGKIIGATGTPGKMPGQFVFAHALAVSPRGDIYVSEIQNWRVQKLVKR